MKKGHRTPVRRKPTKREKTARYNTRVQKVKMKRQNSSEISWDDLNSLYAQSRNAFSVPAILPQVLRNPAVLAQMGDKIDNVYKMVSKVNDDSQQMLVRLNDIHAKHAGKTGPVEDLLTNMDLFAIGNEYANWSVDFDNIIVTGVRDILALANASILNDEDRIVTGNPDIDGVVEHVHG